jgi:hypothetical protein
MGPVRQVLVVPGFPAVRRGMSAGRLGAGTGNVVRRGRGFVIHGGGCAAAGGAGAAVADASACATGDEAAFRAPETADAGFGTRTSNHPFSAKGALYQKPNDSTARTTSGTHMLAGDSCAWSYL